MIDIGQYIVKVRVEKGLKQLDLAHRAEMSPAQLCQIENGRVSPSLRIIERLAGAMDMDVIDLLSCNNSAGQKPKGPSLEAEFSPEKSGYRVIRVVEPDASWVFENIADVEKEYSRREDARGVSCTCTFAFCGSRFGVAMAGAAMADVLRAELGLGTAPIGNLEELLEFRGVRIHHLPIQSTASSVLFWCEPRQTPVIVLNSTNTKERDAYRLAFELGSICLFHALGKMPIDDTPDQHRFLTDFAASFLMPGVTVRRVVASLGIEPKEWTFEKLVSLKERFGVSAETFALRLEELGLINPVLRIELRDMLRDYYKKHPNAMEPRPGKNPFSRWELLGEDSND